MGSPALGYRRHTFDTPCCNGSIARAADVFKHHSLIGDALHRAIDIAARAGGRVRRAPRISEARTADDRQWETDTILDNVFRGQATAKPRTPRTNTRNGQGCSLNHRRSEVGRKTQYVTSCHVIERRKRVHRRPDRSIFC